MSIINDYVKWRSNNVREYTSPLTGESCTLVDFLDENMLLGIFSKEELNGR
jgi:hypothetical protein